MGPIDGVSKPVYIDNMTMHSPCPTVEDTITAWKVLETYVPHQISTLGISNVDLATLRTLYESATVKPALVQNRFTQDTDQSLPVSTPDTAYDLPVRQFCDEHGIVYQPCGTLWGNPKLLESATVAVVAKELDVTNEMALYLCVMSLGKVCVLNGTKSEERMKAGLEGLKKFDEWHAVEGNKQRWADCMTDFRLLMGDDSVGS